MSQLKKQVIVKLQTIIDDKGQQEVSTTKQRGTILRRKARDILFFDERTKEGLKVNNFITLQPHKVSIKRSGQISMYQQFMVNQRDETIYEHPLGTLHMETFTKRLNYKRLDTPYSAKLTIDYNVSLNGQPSRRHQLVLIYEEDQ